MVNEILKFLFVKFKVIEILDKNVSVYNWVKSGLEFNRKNENCLFCDNFILEDRFNFLINYFEN